MEASRLIATNPFHNPLQSPQSHYLLSSWLSPLLAWLLGLTGSTSFFLFHLAFSLAFTALFLRLTFGRLSERTARSAVVLFFALPVSGTAYFWVGMDSLTLLLLLTAFLFPARIAWAALCGLLLGLQHFEQAALALGALWVVVALRRRPAPLGITLAWCSACLVGIVAGKLGLMAIFQRFDVVASSGRGHWVATLLPSLAKQFLSHFQYIAWSLLGMGWLVLLKYLEQGRKALPFTIVLFGIMGLVLFAFDQTRVVAIVSFPLLFVFWLQDSHFLETLEQRFIGWIALSWLFIPWSWVFGGYPQWSILPYDLALVIGRLTGWYEPPSDPFWPLWFEEP